MATRALAALAAAGGAAAHQSQFSNRLLFATDGGQNDVLSAATSAAQRGQAPPVLRYDSVASALAAAREGDALVVVATGYPTEGLAVSAEQWQQAGSIGARMYVEFPSSMPDGSSLPAPVSTQWQRIVVPNGTSMGPELAPLRILSAHKSALYYPMPSSWGQERLVFAKVAGFDTALYGLPTKAGAVSPLLLENNSSFVASSQLSQCRTRRFAPHRQWIAVWNYILSRMCGAPVTVTWEATVRAAFARNDTLPAEAELDAMERAVEWYNVSGLLVSPDRLLELQGAGETGVSPCENTASCPSGTGQAGVLEGMTSDVTVSGSQPQVLDVRDDCTAETSMAFAARAASARAKPADRQTSINLLSFAWVHSGLQRTWSAPQGVGTHYVDSWGMLGWANNDQAFNTFYKDDAARAMLGGIATSGLLKTDRFCTNLAAAVLGNLRITGVNGFGPSSGHFDQLHQNGWRSYFNGDFSGSKSNYSPHYQSYIWAVYLWAYGQTGYAPLLQRAQAAITHMMERYPSWWQPTANGITMQRARMLLPLAWLVRVNDTALHREWLFTIFDGLHLRQDACGAFREEVSAPGWGAAARTPNNDNYGTFEAPLNQENSDTVSDFLYTSNFALHGLHEAAAATGNHTIRESADRLADLVVRIQARSTSHPEVDGAYFRAFDYTKWEAWASDADLGWGAWSVETGWTQSWLSTTLALRTMNTTLWEVGQSVDIKADFQAMLPYYFPPEPKRPCLNQTQSAAVSTTVVTANSALCAPTQGQTRVAYNGTSCGGGRIQWNAMRALDPAPGLKPGSCEWKSAGHDANWKKMFVGTCGVGPIAVPNLPAHFC